MDALALTDALLRGATAALAGLLAALLARGRPPAPAPRLAIALLAGLALQTVAGSPVLEAGLPRPLLAASVGIAVANAVLFWGLARALFDAEARPGAGLLAGWTAAWALGAGNVVLGCAARPEGWAQLAAAAQRALPLVCALGAVWAAARHARGDLVEPRRRLRPLIIVTGAAYSLGQLAMRLGQPGGRLTGAWALADSVLLLAVLAAVAWPLLQLAPAMAWFAQPAPPAAPPEPSAPASADPGAASAAALPAAPAATAPDAEDALVAERLQRALHQDRVYRDGALSVAGLAAQLRCPEYRLRRVIREQLGHGHFSSFLNSHRIAEAQTALADPARRDEPVLAIAMAVGFQSIGPFNRAFKAATGCTPSEFRRQRLADS